MEVRKGKVFFTLFSLAKPVFGLFVDISVHQIYNTIDPKIIVTLNHEPNPVTSKS